MKPLVIYHANCTDGFGAAFAAWLKLGNEAEYVPAEHGTRVMSNLPMFEGRDVYILDFSFSKEDMGDIFAVAKLVVWLDHHKTAFEMLGQPSEGQRYNETSLRSYVLLDNNKSGALLAWEYFHPGTDAPTLIQHIDDRDRWQFKLEGSKEFHAALASYQPWTFEMWRGIFLCGIFEKETWRVPEEFYMEGAATLRTHNQHVQSALKQARPCEIWSFKPFANAPGSVINGFIRYSLNGLAANAPAFLASDLGHELANKSGTFGLIWSMAGDGQIHCSLRSNGDYDVSAIASAFGGGGHRNAAGFSTDIDTLMSWLK